MKNVSRNANYGEIDVFFHPAFSARVSCGDRALIAEEAEKWYTIIFIITEFFLLKRAADKRKTKLF